MDILSSDNKKKELSPARIKNKTADRFFAIIGYVSLIAIFALLIFCINRDMNYWLQSDIASELVYAKLLADENKLISSNWFFSTEIRLLNYPLLASFLFKFTNNWHLVRILTFSMMYLILLGSYYSFCRAFECTRFFAITAVLFLLPFSSQYHGFVLFCDYIPYLCFMFLTLALIEFYRQKNKKVIISCLFFFAVLVGIHGFRMILLLYFPLIASAVLPFILSVQSDEKKKSAKDYLYAAVWTVCGGCIGLLLNILILTKIYHFTQYRPSFVELDFSRAAMIINGFLNCWGYTCQTLFSKMVIQNIACAGWIFITFISLYAILKNWKKIGNHSACRFCIYYLFSLMFFCLLYLFTDMSYTPRYCLPLITCSIPLLVLFLHTIQWSVIAKYCFGSGFVAFLILSSILRYQPFNSRNSEPELKKIASVLTQEKYFSGYAAHWQANILTEFSNGAIDVWAGFPDASLLSPRGFYKTSKYLQKTFHYNLSPQGKLFVLLQKSKRTSPDILFLSQLAKKTIVYQSDNYICFGFDNIGDICLEKKLKSPQNADRIAFNKESSPFWLTFGFSHVESWGIWSEEKNAEMYVALPEKPETYHSIKLTLRPFLSRKGKQEVEIKINDKLVKKVVFTSSQDQQIELPLPKDAQGCLKFNFTVGEPTSPVELKINTDSRELGFGLISLQYEK